MDGLALAAACLLLGIVVSIIIVVDVLNDRGARRFDRLEASTLRLEPEPEFEVGCCAHVQHGRGERCNGPPVRGRLLDPGLAGSTRVDLGRVRTTLGPSRQRINHPARQADLTRSDP
jgi:hypothetical protein